MRPPCVLVTLLALLAIAAACDGGTEHDASPRSSQAADRRVGDAGVTIELRPGWHAGTAADGNIIDPLTRVVVSSAPVHLRPVPCQIAHYAPPPADVTIVVVEWQPSAEAHPPPRPARFTEKALPLQPPPATECFDGAGGTVQFVDHARVFGAYVLAGKEAPRQLVEAARDVLDTLEVTSSSASKRRLARNGVSISVPAGWDGRMLFRDPAGSRGVIFQVANFRLPSNDRLEPPRELPPGQEDPIKAMGSGDVLVTVVGDASSGEPASTTVRLDDLRFLPAQAARVPGGHALAERFLCHGRRCVRVQVDFGRGPPSRALRDAVDEVLASLAF